MLLPSALPCEPRPQLKRYPTYVPNPLSPPPTPDSPSLLPSGISTTCRALQSLLGVHPPASILNKQNKNNTIKEKTQTVRAVRKNASRVVKKPAPPPRGLNKRRREDYEDDLWDGDDQENEDIRLFSTPKRQRRVPPSIPFGLDRSDFYGLSSPPIVPPITSSPQLHNLRLSSSPLPAPSTLSSISTLTATAQNDTEREDGMAIWDTEDDRKLVDLVLEKLKLSKKEWNECARVLGTDEKSLGKRWKVLIDEGQVGLKFRRGGRKNRGDVRDVRWS